MNIRRIADYDVLIIVSLIWFLGKFVRYAFPPLFESLQTSYGVSNTVIGAIFTGFMVVYALLQFPSGIAADRFGSVRVVVAGATIAGFGALALVFDSRFLILIVSMLVIGVGTGLHKTVAVRLIAQVYPARTGRALGAHDTLGAFGGVAAPTIVVIFLSSPAVLAPIIDLLPGAEWRGVFLLTGISSLFLAVAFGLHTRGGVDRSVSDRDTNTYSEEQNSGVQHLNNQDKSTTTEPSAHEYFALFKNIQFISFVFITISVSFAHNGLIAFLPLYLSQVSGVTTTTASLLYSLFFWVTFVQLISGDLSDRVGRFPLMIATGGLAAAALWLLVLTPQAEPIVLGLIIAAIGIGAHGFQPVRSAYLMDTLPDHLAGGGLGVVRTLLMTAGALAPGLVGIVTDISGFRTAFGILSTVMGLSAAGAMILWIVQSNLFRFADEPI